MKQIHLTKHFLERLTERAPGSTVKDAKLAIKNCNNILTDMYNQQVLLIKLNHKIYGAVCKFAKGRAEIVTLLHPDAVLYRFKCGATTRRAR